MELATPSACRLLKIVLTKFPWRKALIENIRNTSNAAHRASNVELSFDPFSYQRRATEKTERDGVKLGGDELIRVVVRQANFDKVAHKIDRMGDYKPEIIYETAQIQEVDPRDENAVAENKCGAKCAVRHRNGRNRICQWIAAFRLLSAKLHARHPILLKDVSVGAAVLNRPERLGSIAPTQIFFRFFSLPPPTSAHCYGDGIGDAILVQGEEAPGQALRLSYNILQAAGSRIFKTDYVACPSCGRTLFNLQTTTAKIKAATLHLKGVKIAIMGCIVNGPGEMADADFGYVGGAPGKVNLYVGKTAVKFNIPEAEAVDRLKDLIREHGKMD